MRPAEHKNEIVGGVEALNEHLFVGPLKALRLDERQGAPSVFRGGPCLPFPAPRTAEVYVDTLCVFFRRRPPLGTVKKNAADAWLKKILDKETRVVQGYLMVVQRPTRDALLALDELQSQFNGVLSRADIAIDVIVNNPEEAQNLDGWLRRNTCLKWVRDFMHDEEHGVYFVWREGRKRSSGRDICMYGDRPSKLGRAGSILHFELRFQLRGCFDPPAWCAQRT